MRTTTVERKTAETNICLTATLDAAGSFTGATGIGFLDHMLAAFCKHGGLDLDLSMTGDLVVDCHHSVEDLGIVLGQALAKILVDKSTITRYGSFFIPMDEALAFCSMDISGRPYLVFDAAFANQQVGAFDCCMTEEFFRALAVNAGITLHIRLLSGANDHHKIEAIFKAVAHALQAATAPRAGGILSTKGTLG